MTMTMKKTVSLMSALMIVLTILTSCSDMEGAGNNAVGYVKLNITTLTSTVTRALNRATYNPKQLAVVITDASGAVVEQTDDYTEWTNKELTLPVGTYRVTASSNGFDGNESGFDIPYYSGYSQFTVGEKTSQTVSVTCTLATVKVTVKFSERFKKVFSEANVNVCSLKEGITPLNFTMGTNYDENIAGYFPVGDIAATINVTSSKGQFSSTKTFENVKARDHYIIHYDVAESGASQIKVIASTNGNTYTYNINVADFSQAILEATDLSVTSAHAADVWNTHATLSASISGIEGFDVANASFEYKSNDDDSYTHVAATESDAVTRSTDDTHMLKAEIRDLTPGQTYTYHVVYDDGTDVYKSTERTFQTEAETELFNGSMDDWYQRPASGFSRRAQWYACTSDYFTTNGTWWDSSNRGTTEGLGWMANKNPTTGESEIVHTSGGKSARLASTSAVGVFAAASLYAGSFNSLQGTNGAKLDWGRPFTSRPKSLNGWYRYNPGTIDYVGANIPQHVNIVKGETPDTCSAYIALVHVDKPNANGTAFSVDNTNMSTFPDWNTDPRVVAYAALPAEQGVDTNSEWKNFSLKLDYKRTDLKPTHIIIVFAASKYGDYFTGSTASKLYLDDLQLIYE